MVVELCGDGDSSSSVLLLLFNDDGASVVAAMAGVEKDPATVGAVVTYKFSSRRRLVYIAVAVTMSTDSAGDNDQLRSIGRRRVIDFFTSFLRL